jgi:exodeoxyribonuclease-3
MRQRNIGWRLDYILASGPLAERARSVSVAREFGTSDHAPVTAVLDVLPPIAGPEEAETKVMAPKRQLSLF